MVHSPLAPIPRSKLVALKDYRYSAMDRSLFSKYVLQPYWTWAATWAPPWMAPNLITLLGFCLVLGNVALLLLVDPRMEGQHAHPWIYFSFAAGIWFYSTLDNVDGKQARRTGTSSPLGELFDHGVDALNTTFGTLLTCAGFGMGRGWLTLTSIWVAVVVFLFSTWETYHTGTLYLGWVNGPSEGIVMGTTYLVLSGSTAIILDLGLVRGPVLSIPLLYFILLGMYGLSFLTQIPVSWVRAFQHNHRLGQSQAVAQVLPVFAYFALLVIWLTAPASQALEHSFFTLLIGMGVGFGEYAATIILHHLLHDPYPWPTEFLAPVAYMALLVRSQPAWLTPSVEQWLTRLVVALTVLWYVLRVRVVIASFCGFLGIQALVIPYPTPAMRLAEELARQVREQQGVASRAIEVEAGATAGKLKAV